MAKKSLYRSCVPENLFRRCSYWLFVRGRPHSLVSWYPAQLQHWVLPSRSACFFICPIFLIDKLVNGFLHESTASCSLSLSPDTITSDISSSDVGMIKFEFERRRARFFVLDFCFNFRFLSRFLCFELRAFYSAAPSSEVRLELRSRREWRESSMNSSRLSSTVNVSLINFDSSSERHLKWSLPSHWMHRMYFC